MAKITDFFKGLTARLQRHVWCVIFFMGLLIFWLAAFVYAGKGSDWASWFSILLAVIVVVHTVLHAFDMRHLISEGSLLMTEKAGDITEKAGVLAEKAGSIEDSIASMRSLERPPAQDIASQMPLRETKFELNISDLWIPHLLVLYSVIKGQSTGRELPLKQITAYTHINQRGDADVIYLSSHGLLKGLQCFLGEHVLESEEGRWRVGALPEGLESYVLGHMAKYENRFPYVREYFKGGKKTIDAYFEERNSSQK